MSQNRFLKIFATLLLLFNLVVCQSVYGQPLVVRPYSPAEWQHSIRVRINEAYARIDTGVANGALTRPEAIRLRDELAQIQIRIKRMARDGRLQPGERKVINDDLDRLYRHIYVEKHDRQRR